jgi:hypothetical protein
MDEWKFFNVARLRAIHAVEVVRPGAVLRVLPSELGDRDPFLSA